MGRSEMEADLWRQELAGMEPAALLTRAEQHDLTVCAVGERLVVRGPRTADPDLVQALLRRKAELMPLLQALAEAQREFLEERAAIMEHDGGLSRAEAERQAEQRLRARG